MKRGLQAATAAMTALSMAAVAGDIRVEGRFISTAPTGTAPLEVSSTTLVENLNADLLKGMPASAFEVALGNVIRVGKTGGDFTSIQAALDSITDAAADNWYVIQLGPGVFNESITLKSYVSVFGHGFLETTIKAEGTGNQTAVVGASLSVISDVGIEARSTDGGDATGYFRSGGGQALSQINRARIVAFTSGSGHATGVDATGNITVRLRDTLVGVGNGALNVGIHMDTPARVSVYDGSIDAYTASNFNYGVWRETVASSSSGSLYLQDSTVRGRNGLYGYGVYADSGLNFTAYDSFVAGTGSTQGVAVLVLDGNATIRNSRVEGTNQAFNIYDSVVKVIYSEVEGPISSGSGTTLSCMGVYDASLAPVTCP